MSNTYTQIHIQCVMAVKYRQALIQPEWKDQLQKYITGIVQNHGHKVIAIDNMPDHLHLFFGFRPNQSLSDLMRIVKGESSEWINLQRFTPTVFRWQEGYGAFSYSRSHVQRVTNYVMKQGEHHKKHTFLEEYRQLLEQFEIKYDERYIFKEPE
ncbi:IS200/IS605 family transposase [Mucilaginibacter ginsenosidivorans]|uniref:IS200/IS605 family transposase n=1 Tax=Mucilaginibacter ginsenosidivorans TaxID=398053 RepID=A0A5B8UVN4_9SPHI|nr:IS200/IS605 family transposase [Mucilaginibacter ginsenosidivorans]QEC62795.1 IS200/IS605 family transposase [Mucilaginibacter ginsenosidivorans]